jgi:hypothetical protein
MIASKWVTSISLVEAISSACSMSYIQEMIHPIKTLHLSHKIMDNCGLFPGIFSRVKSVRVLLEHFKVHHHNHIK